MYENYKLFQHGQQWVVIMIIKLVIVKINNIPDNYYIVCFNCINYYICDMQYLKQIRPTLLSSNYILCSTTNDFIFYFPYWEDYNLLYIAEMVRVNFVLILSLKVLNDFHYSIGNGHFPRCSTGHQISSADDFLVAMESLMTPTSSRILS